jgi:ribonuclease P protein component
LKNECGYHRFAVSVKKKIGNAVERNFIKRKMRELFRTNQHLVERKYDLWIVMKDRFIRTNTGELREVEDLFLQALRKMNHSYDFKDK